MFKIAVLVSGGGTNLNSIIQAIKERKLKNCCIEMVISDNPNVGALDIANNNNIKNFVVDKKNYGKNQSEKILELVNGKVDLIVLAGYLSIIDGEILKMFSNKIINIHPSLIPSFCGKGMYGLNVHKSVIDKGVKVSGCTVHFVNNGIDEGAIILQKTVEVYFDDTPEILQKRVLEQEHNVLVEAIKLISEEKIEIVNSKVKFL